MSNLLEKEKLIRKCPICYSEQLEYRFIAAGRVISACTDCGHMFSNPQNLMEIENSRIYEKDSFERFISNKGGSKGESLFVQNQEELATPTDARFDVIVLDMLDNMPDPETVLQKVHDLLNTDGLLFLSVLFLLP